MEFYLKVQTAIQKAIVYDAVTDGALENHTLLIENGKIVYAGPREQAPEYEAVSYTHLVWASITVKW